MIDNISDTEEATMVENTSPAQDEKSPINYEMLLRRCAGNAGFACSIIEKFLRRALPDIEELEQILAAGDAPGLAVLAQRFKSCAADLSADGVREKAEEVEAMGRAGNLEGARVCIERLRSEFARFRHYVSKTCAIPPG